MHEGLGLIVQAEIGLAIVQGFMQRRGKSWKLREALHFGRLTAEILVKRQSRTGKAKQEERCNSRRGEPVPTISHVESTSCWIVCYRPEMVARDGIGLENSLKARKLFILHFAEFAKFSEWRADNTVCVKEAGMWKSGFWKRGWTQCSIGRNI
jgi:hypothetical protein